MSEVKTTVCLSGPVHKLCDDNGRYSLAHVLVSKACYGVYLTATNGRGLVARSELGHTDESVYMPSELCKGWNKQPECKLNGQWEAHQRKAKTTQVMPAIEPENQRYPRVSDVMKPVNQDEFMAIKLNAKTLFDIMSALKGDTEEENVTLFISREQRNYAMILGEKGIGAMGLTTYTRDEDKHVKADYDKYNSTLDDWSSNLQIAELNDRMKKPEKKK